MWLDLLMFCITVLALGWAFDQRNARIMAQRDLGKERSLTETLGVTLGQVRSRLEAAERALTDLGDGPAPRPETRIRRGK